MEMPREEGFSFSLSLSLFHCRDLSEKGRMKRKKNKTHLLLPFLPFLFFPFREREEREGEGGRKGPAGGGGGEAKMEGFANIFCSENNKFLTQNLRI